MVGLVEAVAGVGSTALQGLFQNVLVPGFQSLGTALAPLQPQIDALGAALNPLVVDLSTIGERLQPVTDFFNNLATAIRDATAAVTAFKLPDFLQPAGVAGTPAPLTSAGTPTSFATTGTQPSGPLVQINTVNIGSEVDADSFLARLAGQIADAAGRVAVPPDNASHPTLLPSVT
jgi:hypothetical protein